MVRLLLTLNSLFQHYQCKLPECYPILFVLHFFNYIPEEKRLTPSLLNKENKEDRNAYINKHSGPLTLSITK